MEWIQSPFCVPHVTEQIISQTDFSDLASLRQVSKLVKSVWDDVLPKKIKEQIKIVDRLNKESTCNVREAARNGHLDTIKAYIKRFRFDAENLPCFTNELTIILYNSIEQGHVDIPRYLFDAFKITPLEYKVTYFNHTFDVAVEKGHVKIVKYLIDTFGITLDDIRSNTFCILAEASHNDHLDMVKFLIKTFGITKSYIQENNYRAFIEAASSGHIDTVEWLTSTFNILPEEISPQRMMMIYNNLCCVGNTHSLEWICRQIPIETQEDNLNCCYMAIAGKKLDLLQWVLHRGNRTFDNTNQRDIIRMFQNAASFGSVDIVRFLVSYFRITKTMARNGKNSALKDSVTGGHYELVKYLVDHFKLPSRTIKSEKFLIFQYAISNGRLDILKYLIDRYNVTFEETQTRPKSFFVIACECGVHDIVDYLIKIYGLNTKPFFDRELDIGFSLAAYNGEYKVLDYLNTNYHILANPKERREDSYSSTERIGRADPMIVRLFQRSSRRADSLRWFLKNLDFTKPEYLTVLTTLFTNMCKFQLGIGYTTEWRDRFVMMAQSIKKWDKNYMRRVLKLRMRAAMNRKNYMVNFFDLEFNLNQQESTSLKRPLDVAQREVYEYTMADTNYYVFYISDQIEPYQP